MAVARSRFYEISDYVNAGTENFCYWNMVLNETRESGWDWRQNSLIVIDRKAGVIEYQPDYLPMVLISSFIRPGDQSVKTTSKSRTVAVTNDKKTTVFLQNDRKKEWIVTLTVGHRKETVRLKPQSLSALILESPAEATL